MKVGGKNARFAAYGDSRNLFCAWLANGLAHSKVTSILPDIVESHQRLGDNVCGTGRSLAKMESSNACPTRHYRFDRYLPCGISVSIIFGLSAKEI